MHNFGSHLVLSCLLNHDAINFKPTVPFLVNYTCLVLEKRPPILLKSAMITNNVKNSWIQSVVWTTPKFNYLFFVPLPTFPENFIKDLSITFQVILQTDNCITSLVEVRCLQKLNNFNNLLNNVLGPYSRKVFTYSLS